MENRPEIVLSLIQLVGLSLPAIAILLQVAGRTDSGINTDFNKHSAPFLAIRWSFIPLIFSGAFLLLYIVIYYIFGVIEYLHTAIFIMATMLLLIFISLISLGMWFMSGNGLRDSVNWFKNDYINRLRK